MAEEYISELFTGSSPLTIYAWLVIAFPFVTGTILTLLRLYELRNVQDGKDDKLPEMITGGLGVGGLLGSLFFSLLITIQYFRNHVNIVREDGHISSITIQSVRQNFPFLPTASGSFEWGILLNPLSVIMMLLLAIIASLIHIYATGYMHDESAYTRFFGGLNLFTGSMFGFILASNLFMGFIFWELLGFTSYLLIGYYWPKRSASSAAKKAFLYNKVGDVSFMIGIALVWAITFRLGDPTLDYFALKSMVTDSILGVEDLWLPGLLMFGGAIGKSSQVPLFGWLPEAMEGPTPVSALLHSSTMVKAGLYLVARIFFTFFDISDELSTIFVEESLGTATFIAWVGVLTALIGALIATAATDIKRVLAYSTISQLGYIGMALGAGGLSASFFHLISHATFKSLLFLCAGAVIHAVHSQELRDMGGLKKYMPYTTGTMAVGLIALAGFPLTSGFWSKDAVLVSMRTSEVMFAEVGWGIAVFTAGITAFYATKLFILTFLGDPQYNEEKVHPHEAGMKMRIPLIILAGAVIIESFWWLIGVGFGVSSWNFEETLAYMLGQHGESFTWASADPYISMVVVFAGIGLSYFIYGMNGLTTLRKSTPVTALYNLARDNPQTGRFYFDRALYGIAEGPVMWVGDRFDYIDREIIDDKIIDKGFRGYALVVGDMTTDSDRKFIDGFVIKGLEDLTSAIGRQFRKLQNGLAPWYARLMVLSLGLFLTVFSFFVLTGLQL